MTVVVSHSEAETEAVGERVARSLGAGAVVLIDGPLGAGKTAFVRGMAAGIGVEAALVSSPTFTLLHEYAGPRLTLFHADLYRLSVREVADLGLADVSAEGILAVEWPDRWTTPPGDAVRVSLAKGDGDVDERVITVG